MHTVRARGVGRLGRRAGRPSSRLVLSPADCSRVSGLGAPRARATGWRVRICPGGRILGYPQGRGPCAPVRRTRHRHRAMSSGLVNYALPVIYSCTVRRSIPGLEEMFRSWTA